MMYPDPMSPHCCQASACLHIPNINLCPTTILRAGKVWRSPSVSLPCRLHQLLAFQMFSRKSRDICQLRLAVTGNAADASSVASVLQASAVTVLPVQWRRHLHQMPEPSLLSVQDTRHVCVLTLEPFIHDWQR